MFSVILYMLRQTVGHRAPPLPVPSFSPLTVTFPKLAVILRPLYWRCSVYNEAMVLITDKSDKVIEDVKFNISFSCFKITCLDTLRLSGSE
jgi:hypothetical protein